MVPAGNKDKRLSSVSHTKKTINQFIVVCIGLMVTKSIWKKYDSFFMFCFLPILVESKQNFSTLAKSKRQHFSRSKQIMDF